MITIVAILLCYQLDLISCNDLYSKFQQKDYEVEFTRLEIADYNKDVYKRFEIVTFKHNRSLAVANATFQQKIDLSKLEVVIQCYKFLSNEYRIFPIRFQLNLCRLLQQNIAGLANIISRCGNVRSCNFKKDVVHHVCNIYPDQSKLPPFIPSGEFKAEITVVQGNLTACVINGYGKIFRPLKN